MLTLAAALLCMEESLNRFESTSNEREMTVKMLHVLGKPEWNSEYRFSGRVLFGVSGSQYHGKTQLKLSAPLFFSLRQMLLFLERVGRGCWCEMSG
jgi:hypothetical protein